MKNNIIDKTVNLSNLFEIYKHLLTDKQQEYFTLYINEDLSLNEIAEEFEISKTAVHDSITKTIKLLNQWEEKLNLKEKQDKLISLIKKLENNDINNSEITKILKEVI
ncbi:YlxM family DNA-binding protein [Mycoplasma sp. HU2014]|uniref:YlxM family DNA-binding protein n=1 Tax=Mycoplasma sp. HU2014 TaxID=1664275 RepID=UPI00067C76AB|nr:sigma factor-like helix-turn-helix DNA-binding protein [Mycoplasma sp. HU2014]KNG79108.1 YlxM/p13 family DNA-binding protein [Mycoplasma sp. HU2014]